LLQVFQIQSKTAQDGSYLTLIGRIWSIYALSRTYFACRTRASTPAARGVAADVPVKESMHPWLISVVH